MTTKSHKTNPADKVEQWPIEKLVPYAKTATHADTGKPFAEVKHGNEEAKN